MRKEDDEYTGNEQEEARAGYRRTLQQLTQMTEVMIRELHESHKTGDEENNHKKELPAQLLKLTQLLEKILTLVEKIEPEVQKNQEKIPYQLIWKYLKKKRENDPELS